MRAAVQTHGHTRAHTAEEFYTHTHFEQTCPDVGLSPRLAVNVLCFYLWGLITVFIYFFLFNLLH